MQNKNKNQTSQYESSLEPLNDFKKNGKKESWDRVKADSNAVSRAYSYIPGLEHYGEKIASCGNWLKFMECDEVKHGKLLKQAYFCKTRGCIMCQWRKSLVIRKQLMELVKGHRAEYSTDVPLLITLTVLNEKGENVSKTIDQMNAAWKRLMELKAVKGVVHSWFRSLEITYNKDRDDYHPHYHALLMVPQNYFYKKRGLYITHEEWLKLWQQSMRDDRITQVDIRPLKCKTDEELWSSIGESAKYMTKPSSYIFKNEEGKLEANPKVVEELHYVTKGRRLIGFGGLFNKIRKAKKMVDIEKANLVDVDGLGIEDICQCKVCQKEMIEKVYNWYEESNRYLRRIPKVEEEVVSDTEIPVTPTIQKVKSPSILLEALRKSLQERRGQEETGTSESGVERIQCRGPT